MSDQETKKDKEYVFNLLPITCMSVLSTLLLIWLKLIGAITSPWWAVFLPFYGLILGLIAFALVFFVWAFCKNEESK